MANTINITDLPLFKDIERLTKICKLQNEAIEILYDCVTSLKEIKSLDPKGYESVKIKMLKVADILNECTNKV